MTESIPTKLFKYQAYNDYSIKNIKERTIYFSKPEKLNDPFDMSVPLTTGRKYSEYQEASDYIKQITGLEPRGKQTKDGKITKAYIDDYKKVFQEESIKRKDEFRDWGVACFSEMPNNYPENILMWSHYANGHKGFCFEFDTSKKPFSESKKVLQVIYSSFYPYIHPKFIIEKLEYPITPIITKSKNWKYEREWRLISKSGDSTIQYESNALTAIYFGCLMPDVQMKEICSILYKSSVLFYKMRMSETKFKLFPETFICK